jgi:outer membrane autotransporter protein
VLGNYAQLAGSTYQVEVDPVANTSDLIQVGGGASIDSGSQLEVVRTGSGSFAPGARYTVLSAAGGVTGNYSLLGDIQSVFMRVTDSYDANHVYLTAEKIRNVADAGGTPNEVAVGGAVDSLPGNNGLGTAVAWLPTEALARRALSQLAADIYASSKTAALEDSRFVREAAFDRLREANCATDGAPQTPQQNSGCASDGQTGSGWVKVFGAWGSIDSDGNAAKLKRGINGLFAGADIGLGEDWRAGVLAGYSRANADISARSDNSDTDSYHLSVYGGTQWDATALRLGASHSWSETDTRRSINFEGSVDRLTGNYDSTTAQVFGELGHRIDTGSATFEPFAGLAYVKLRSDAFSERGGLAALHEYGATTDTTFSSVGLRTGVQVVESTHLRGLLAWRHAFGDTTPTSTLAFSQSQSFTVGGVPLAEDVAALEVGIETRLRAGLLLSADYSGQLGDGLKDHGLKVNLNWSF